MIFDVLEAISYAVIFVDQCEPLHLCNLAEDINIEEEMDRRRFSGSLLDEEFIFFRMTLLGKIGSELESLFLTGFLTSGPNTDGKNGSLF